MCNLRDKNWIWLILIIVIFFLATNRDNSSTPLNFDTFFELDSSTPFF